MSFFRTLLFNRIDRLTQAVRLTVLAVFTALALGGCAGWFGGDPLRVNVAGIDPAEGRAWKCAST